MNEHVRTYDVRLVGAEPTVAARVVVTVRDWTEDGVRNRSCSVAITWRERTVSSTSHNVYQAFQEARAQLETFGLTPDCNGSCPEVRTSGMLCDMGDGTFAYRMDRTTGTGSRPINIFDSEPGLKLGTVTEQKAYWREMHNRRRLTSHAPDGS